MIYVISDLHGYPFEKFLELLHKAQFSADDHLYVIGDVIDRGGDGIRYLQWLMEQDNAELLLGNHELMMRSCDFLFDPSALQIMQDLDKAQKRKLALWMSNGAKCTVEGLFDLDQSEREKIFAFLNQLRTYKRLTVGDRDFLLVHSGLREFDPDKPLDDYSVEDLVWNRPYLPERYFDDCMTILGHTPTFMYGEEYKGGVMATDTWIDIDAGAGYGFSPVLLCLDDMTTLSL